MSNLTVIGLQWGDEGKGKIVDWASEHADVVVRFQGGRNAGHTIVVNDKTYKLSQVPSGVLRPGKVAIIGNGVVLDPCALISEIQDLRSLGITIDTNNLFIADNAVLVLPLHGELDRLREERSGKGKIGTTGKGIGPAYEDKIGRRAIRLVDLAKQTHLNAAIDRLIDHHNLLRKSMHADLIDKRELEKFFAEISGQILPYASSVWKLLNEFHDDGKRILFEGAQGTFLDIDFGTYPFVTSSTTLSSGAAVGSGLSPKKIGYILGACKTYLTRVGEGPFPTEQINSIGNHLAKRGKEFGTVTGRPRRCGWFDAPMVRTACILSGVDGIALMKLDVLDGLDELKICTSYKLDGELLNYMPTGLDKQTVIEPVYETFPGWDQITSGIKSKQDLPAAALNYVERLEQFIGCSVEFASTSPKREDTISLKGQGIFK